MSNANSSNDYLPKKKLDNHISLNVEGRIKSKAMSAQSVLVVTAKKLRNNLTVGSGKKGKKPKHMQQVAQIKINIPLGLPTKSYRTQ